MSVNTMIFDQYSRYKACADLLRQAGFISGRSVLDIGSGPECLFGQFMPDANMSYVDPLISADSIIGKISGDIFSKELDGMQFDCVSAVDVLEHVAPERRQAFLKRLASLGAQTLILGFPSSDSSEASIVDKTIDGKYHAIFGHKYSWLEEHYRYGLPSLAATVEELESLGWHCRTIGHGHAPWLTELLGFVICVWDIPSMRPLVQEISEEFNRKLYPFDFSPPFYRQFLVASRKPLPKLIAPPANTDFKPEEVFRSLMETAWKGYFSASLKEINEQNERISALTHSTLELSAWGSELQASVSTRDQQISTLTQRTFELSDWGVGLQALIKLRDEQILMKQAELVKISDWANGMLKELDRLNSFLVVRFISKAKRLLALGRKKLAQSFIGDLVRYLRDLRRWREKQVSLEALKQSLKANEGNLIVVFPVITWDFRWQRPQQIVSRLRDQGYSVLYLAMTLTPQGRRLRGDKDAVSKTRFNTLDRHINQIWLSTSKQLNIYTDPLEGDDLHNVSAGLSALIAELNPKSIKYLIHYPGWWPAVKAVKEKLAGTVVFDCMDDHGGFSTNTKQSLVTENELLKSADLVITSADLLEQRAKKYNANTIQVKNGTEFEHFANPVVNGELNHLTDHPIIGYYGAISDWFDMENIAHCASKRPDWNFVLIGSTFGADLNPVKGLKNVHFLGEKPYKDLPGYLAYFDVCTIPFKIIPLTLATNPVKFYEYLSAGKPVVSVMLPELVPYKENCYLASNSDEFLELIDRAYVEREDKFKIERRISLAKENSWDSRASKILESFKFQSNFLR
jgi:hypothetical protein